MTKAIISPYEDVFVDDKTVGMPTAVVDTGADAFDSSDIPSSMIDDGDGERLIIMDAEHHALAVALGYTEVDV